MAMKNKKGTNLSIFVVVFSVFLFGCYMYNEDVKSIAQFPFSSPKSKPQELQNEQLQKQSTPDVVTFLGVMCACCHHGLIDEGRKQFSGMVKDYQLLPRIEHYGCMVDLLGRARFLMEAHDLIKEMRLRPDPVIWRAFLGACKIHGNTQLGEFPVKNILDLEPNNAENYVMLANLYARDRRWVKVGEVRALMDQRSIQKVLGCSSIEIYNVVYEFIVSYIIKPELEEVHRLLAEMNMELKLNGYFLDTDMVSYVLEFMNEKWKMWLSHIGKE